MSSEAVTSIPTLPAEATIEITEPAKKKAKVIYVHPKTQKQLDTLKAKNEKLVADTKGLKKQLSDLKSSYSRIRRIPKHTPEE